MLLKLVEVGIFEDDVERGTAANFNPVMTELIN